ncbi:3 beta-hydroxysteroid dehydrogenase/Delta 5--_4-isomerase type 1-like [Hyla sarda]|uniref:3 beta-hydroxysteroid dehydrogenase/Delta 5-->4-isomerase type 1-like n=1 Tax=Hyla sarda TaxID=327740 RepID=UPI0024C2D238|nr:3 beta-hydroxysteroid dehydrogenase/Delta 5-->4-isomerase type 1-like [Hyla sarda]
MSGALSGVSCLVTGAGGFVGLRIVQMLLEEEDLGELRAMDKTVSGHLLQTCERSQKKIQVKVLEGDIRDKEFLHKACQGVDLVIHTAAIIDPTGHVSKETFMSINLHGTELILESCVKNNVRYFIYTSSMEVVGPNTRGDPIVNGHEDLVYDSTLGSCYGESKRQGEWAVLRASGRELQNGGSLVTCSLRPTYIFGEGSQFLQMHIDQAIQNGGVFHRISKKEALVNPVYVGNVAWAHVVAARAMRDPDIVKKMAGNFYYICDDTPHMSYSDLNHALGAELGLGVEGRLAFPYPLLYFVASIMELVSFLLRPFIRFVPPLSKHLLILLNTTFTFSYKKAQRDMGYSPRYSWAEARRMTSTWIASILPQRKEELKKK